ncbi:hypothetical protein [Pseudarthrobacter sp. PS3-L1]|uniref:hypothetical protein n=1 Tax=Pseudarthrobacter sp. PS3-L1 TaxID=3046207 RepID=UPI0024B9F051|nr:hypothetical protein [Pseudarthrobacter sp. PS3-L1]MDJ0321400.1 hypothetical protein [Pseudarthrobacter sp. PS3-L1]
MYQTHGDGWQITMDASGPLMIALFVRDAAGLHNVGQPLLPAISPRVRAVDHSHLTAEVGGLAALQTEWAAWWDQLLRAHPQTVPELTPPNFEHFANSPALQMVLRAHFGTALTWTRERRSDYSALEIERQTAGSVQVFADLVDDRLLELGRRAHNFTLTIIELPLKEHRAWFLEPDRIIMSDGLLADPVTFRSYVQPVIELLV